MKTEPFVDDVLRKIGRNMVLFQRLEVLLKFIISKLNINGSPDDIKKQTDTIMRNTLGQLVGQYVDHLNPDYTKPEKKPDLAKFYFNINFHSPCGSKYFDDKKEALAKLVSDRNDLIHHLVPLLDVTSSKSCETLGCKLDAQADVIRSEIKNMTSIAQKMHSQLKQVAEYLQSPEGTDWLMNQPQGKVNSLSIVHE